MPLLIAPSTFCRLGSLSFLITAADTSPTIWLCSMMYLVVIEMLVNDEPLREYEDNHPSAISETVVNYIEAKPRKHLKVRYTFTDPPSNTSISGQVSIGNSDWKYHQVQKTTRSAAHVRNDLSYAHSFDESTYPFKDSAF